MRTSFRPGAGIMGVLALTLGCASACAPSYPAYTGTIKASATTPLDQAGVELSLPAGWKFSEQPPSFEGVSSLTVGKGAVGYVYSEEGKGVMSVMCLGTFISRGDLPTIGSSGIEGALPGASLVTGPFELPGTGGPNPVFEVYEGTATYQGRPVPVYALHAYKFTRGFGCKYSLVGIVVRPNWDGVKDDMIAIAASLTN